MGKPNTYPGRNASLEVTPASAKPSIDPLRGSREDFQDNEKDQDVTVIPDNEQIGWTTSQDNPLNWSLLKKTWHVFIVGLTCWLVTFGTSVYTPGSPAIAEGFSVSAQIANLGLSLYSLGLGAGPCIGAPLSETFGRWIVFATAVPVSALFTLGAGFSQSIGALLVCRFFAGLVGGPPLSIGGGVLADMVPAHDRAIAGSIFIAAPFLGPCTGESPSNALLRSYS